MRLGQQVNLALPKHGMRSYLAVSGGFDVPPVLLPTRQMGIKQLLFGNRVRSLPRLEYQEFSAEAREAFWRVVW